VIIDRPSFIIFPLFVASSLLFFRLPYVLVLFFPGSTAGGGGLLALPENLCGF
jgi:hypothetical protein